MCDDVSSRNLKHIQKHLADLQALDHTISLEDIVRLGRQIASRPENLIGTPGGRTTFEEIVTIGSEQVRVRVVLNPSGGLRSVHRRKLGSMKITWRLDEEMPLDPENLLGDITLSHGHTVLQERQTYIDSWLDALITGLQAVQAGKAMRVDILEEPDALVFEPVEKGVRLSYRTLALDVESVEALHDALLLAATAFLQKLTGVEGWERNAVLHSIRDFVSHPQEVSSKADMHT